MGAACYGKSAHYTYTHVRRFYIVLFVGWVGTLCEQYRGQDKFLHTADVQEHKLSRIWRTGTLAGERFTGTERVRIGTLSCY